MKTILIINPTANGGRAAQQYPRILQMLRDLDVPFDYELTTRAGETQSLAANAITAGYERLVAVGGDGTLNEVADVILHRNPALIFGAIPAGNGNDYVKSVGIPPSDLTAACRILKSGAVRLVDVGLVNQRYFLNIATAGLDVKMVERSSRLRFLHGFTLYLTSVLLEIFDYQPAKLQLAIDHQAVIHDPMLVVIANGKCYGGAFKVAPLAEVTDGLLNAISFSNVNPLRRILALLRVANGSHLKMRECRSFLAKKLELQFDVPPKMQVDGEVLALSDTKVTVQILPQTLRLWGPRTE